MNRLTAIRTYEPVPFAEWSFIATTEVFPDGCLVVTDAHTGRRRATGRNSFGAVVTLPLDVPLCAGCDNPIDNGVCAHCELVFTNPPELQPDSKGFWL